MTRNQERTGEVDEEIIRGKWEGGKVRGETEGGKRHEREAEEERQGRSEG